MTAKEMVLKNSGWFRVVIELLLIGFAVMVWTGSIRADVTHNKEMIENQREDIKEINRKLDRIMELLIERGDEK